LTDLNPSYRALQVSQPERMDWTNQYGGVAFGHVLKPIDYIPGQRYPLIVTTYLSRGFLRGGVGDEYPAQVFAANGFVVLSFDRPRGYGLYSPKAPQPADTHTLEYASPTSSIEIAVRKLAEQGLVDPKRVGGTGLSNGATTVCYAVTHSDVFQAAAVSNLNGEDPMFFYLSAGVHRRQWEYSGFGGLPDQGPNAARWREVSPALNAKRVTAPILVNAPADEYLMALQFYHSLKALNKPVELMIYPNEGHIKHQPVHRYTIYQRNLDWFGFWFLGRERSRPLTALGESAQGLADQYARWRELGQAKQ
jgi:dipeptidyl aminopeptidase/acylaminoacyl peptidase